MKDLKNKVIVITGAASGIGRALALSLAKEQALLALADKNANGLKAVCKELDRTGTKYKSYVLDVSNAVKVKEFANKVRKDLGVPCILMNIAGVTLIGPVEDLKYRDIKWIIDTNLHGTINCVKEFLKYLRMSAPSLIVNTSSILGLAGVAYQSFYSATKFAIRGFTESLRQELKGSGVEVSLIIPGVVKTNAIQNARHNISRFKVRISEVKKIMDASSDLDPDEAAEKIIKGIKKDQKRILIGRSAHIIDKMVRLLPVKYENIIYKNFVEKLLNR